MHTEAFLKMKADKIADWGDHACDHPHIVEEWHRGSKTGLCLRPVWSRCAVDEDGIAPA